MFRRPGTTGTRVQSIARSLTSLPTGGGAPAVRLHHDGRIREDGGDRRGVGRHRRGRAGRVLGRRAADGADRELWRSGCARRRRSEQRAVHGLHRPGRPGRRLAPRPRGRGRAARRPAARQRHAGSSRSRHSTVSSRSRASRHEAIQTLSEPCQGPAHGLSARSFVIRTRVPVPSGRSPTSSSSTTARMMAMPMP